MTALETRLAIQDVMTRYAAGVDDRNILGFSKEKTRLWRVSAQPTFLLGHN